MASFEPAFDFMIQNEVSGDRVYLHDPDTGERAKYGISNFAYPDLDIEALTLQEAKALYRRDYWDKNRLDEIHNQKVANAVLDMVVHHGRGIAVVQAAINLTGASIPVDNAMGPITLTALNAIEPKRMLDALVKARQSYMRTVMQNQPVTRKYAGNWLSRAERMRQGLSLPQTLGLGALVLGLGAWVMLGGLS